MLAGFRTSGSKATPNGRVLGRPEVRGGAMRGGANRGGACGRGVVSTWAIVSAGSTGGPTLGFTLSLLPASLSSSGTNGIHFCSASWLQCWDPQGLVFLTSKKVVTRGDRQEDKLES